MHGLHINLESDYAVRIVRALAQSFDKRVDAKTLADTSCVSLRFTLKIMRKLVSADIARSYKGSHGGYTLTRLPGEITLRQVIEAVEGPYRFSRCLDEEYDCTCKEAIACPFHSVFDDVTAMVVQKLDTITFDQMI
ncbi:MAG: RrF2 family transcriptional regulator [Acutalibacteraceae bacterium]